MAQLGLRGVLLHLCLWCQHSIVRVRLKYDCPDDGERSYLQKNQKQTNKKQTKIIVATLSGNAVHFPVCTLDCYQSSFTHFFLSLAFLGTKYTWGKHSAYIHPLIHTNVHTYVCINLLKNFSIRRGDIKAVVKIIRKHLHRWRDIPCLWYEVPILSKY